jgi:hypothetical protein
MAKHMSVSFWPSKHGWEFTSVIGKDTVWLNQKGKWSTNPKDCGHFIRFSEGVKKIWKNHPDAIIVAYDDFGDNPLFCKEDF